MPAAPEVPATGKAPAAADTALEVPVAVVLDGPPTPAWQAAAVTALEATQGIAISRLRLLDHPGLSPGLLGRLRAALERHVFAIDPQPLAPVTVIPREAPTSPALTLWLAESRPPPFTDGPDEADGVPSDPEAQRAPGEGGEPCGILFLRHDGSIEPAGRAFGRALLARRSSLESELLLHRANSLQLVERTVSEVRPFSEVLSRTLTLAKLSALAARSTVRVAHDSDSACEAARASITPGEPPSELRLTARAVAAALRTMLTRVFYRRPWSIVIQRAEPEPDGVATGSPSPRMGFRSPIRDQGLVRWGGARMYADPFLFEHDGAHHLFCEEVPRDGKRGVISHTVLHPDGRAADPPVPVLRAPHHLSYPFVFAHEGELLMIPETSATRRVELYRACSFPGEWELDSVLLEDLDAADATLLDHDGLLWLFASVAAPGASSLDELQLFYADRLRGPWHPHPLNPIVSDVRCARPAGAIQRQGTVLVRPAQDCSRRYGWAISFRQIDRLSTTEYAEHEIDRIEPSCTDGARAVHTYSADGLYRALDLRRRETRLVSLTGQCRT